jgi:hypothetical protein
VGVVPLVRASGSLQTAGVRIVAAALLVLVAALVRGWSPLVPVAIAATGGLYAAQLAVDDATLDGSAPVVATGILLVAELAYWSLEERDRVPGDPGDGLRRVAFVGVLAIGALVVGGLLLALVEFVQAEGLALDVVGAVAASAILATVVIAGRSRGRSGH